jgi:oligopeptide transport system permease protein
MASAITAPALAPEEYAGGTVAREQTSLWRDGLRRLRRNKLAWASTFWLLGLVVVGIVAIFWTPYPPNLQNVCLTFDVPSAQHLMGCDELGRDVLSRIMTGTQVSLIEGVGTAILVLAVGVTVGLFAGFFRGKVDGVISLIINIFYGVPTLLVALVLVDVLGPGLINIMIAIAATVWMDMTRLVRGQSLALREREFVEAARASGAKSMRIVFGHILPNALGPIIVQATFVVPIAILTGAFLSFLGLGIPPPQSDWGGMANEGYQAFRYVTHILVFPSLALSVTLVAFNFLGDGLRDAFDPRQKR